MLLTINNLTFSYGIHTIFNNLDFRINTQEGVGIIGSNGCGKSTFLKLITEELTPESGEIHKQSQLTIGILNQEFNSIYNQTLHTFYLQVFSHLIEMENEMQTLQDKIETATEEELNSLVHKQATLHDQYAEKGGFEYNSRIRGVTIGLGFSLEDLNKTMDQFSGGEKTRIALGALLLQSPDLLLLDEPSNYLDFQALAWLESTLSSYKGAFIIVSHDRYFLNKVCTRICEVENQAFLSYDGNYSTYCEKKEKRDLALKHASEKQMQEAKRQSAIIQRLRNYNSIQSSKRAASREKVMAKMEVTNYNESYNNIHFSFQPKITSGNDVLVVTDLAKGFNDTPLFKNVNFEVKRGDKIGIIGSNGIGKTTLFQILTKRIKPDSGRVTLGRKVVQGYYTQEPDNLVLSPESTLIDAIRDIDFHLNDGQIRNILASFLFTGESVFKKVEDLSGGEKARLNMARLMVSESNFLLMDEPTNHIDMQTREILELALSAYDGTLLFISHDRYFLNKVATQIYQLTPNGFEKTLGNFDDYLNFKQKEADRAALLVNDAPQLTKTQQKEAKKREKQLENQLRQEKKQLKALESKMEKNDQLIQDYENQMCLDGFYDDLEKSQMINNQYENLIMENQELMLEWEELAQKLEAME